MTRIRDLFPDYSSWFPTGRYNSIADVMGVGVGHCTIFEDSGADSEPAPFRTGVSVIRPHPGNLYEDKVSAAVTAINGYGKPAGFEQVYELGCIETPIALAGTLISASAVLEWPITYFFSSDTKKTSFNHLSFHGKMACRPPVSRKKAIRV